MLKIYTLPTCPWCIKAKEFFKKNKIKFKDINVENSKAAEEMEKISGQRSVPVIDINGKIIIGFDKEALKKALKV